MQEGHRCKDSTAGRTIANDLPRTGCDESLLPSLENVLLAYAAACRPIRTFRSILGPSEPQTLGIFSRCEYDTIQNGSTSCRTWVPYRTIRLLLCDPKVRNKEIGYCQSMNFVVATMLMYCSEEQSFWILCSLVEDVLPEGYYTETLSGLRAATWCETPEA